MKIVVVGSGGREHAICYRLRIDGHEVIAVPGNPGIAEICDVYEGDPKSLDADLFVIGPEAPLVAGLADELRLMGKVVFGPGRDGARLEGSKAFMKEVAAKANVPTANYEVFEDTAQAHKFLEKMQAPYVVKTDGLAGGKGVLVTNDLDLAKRDVGEKLSGSTFGEAGRRVIIEEGLVGKEVSLLAITDGKKALALIPATDHKRLLNGDLGPNTGGMGAYAPVPWLSQAILDRAMTEIVQPTIDKLVELQIDYRGVLYAGLMITESGPKLIEFNVRFGDPEAQVVLPLIEGDFGQLMLEAALGNLLQTKIKSNGRAAVTVVMAAPGYPQKPVIGAKISLPPTDVLDRDLVVFHAGTAKDEQGNLHVSGGRVLAITGIASSIETAREKAYKRLEVVYFQDAQWRDDIASNALVDN